MLANLIQAHFGVINNWPGGSALAILAMIIVGAIVMLYIGMTRLAMRHIT
jgi:ABC-type spermidine/putrescine transport system permease subunit I